MTEIDVFRSFNADITSLAAMFFAKVADIFILFQKSERLLFIKEIEANSSQTHDAYIYFISDPCVTRRRFYVI